MTLPVWTAVGMPAEIVQGDSWSTALGRAIEIRFRDADGDTVNSFGTKAPDDSDFTWELRFYPSPAVQGVSATMEASGDENDWDATTPVEPFLNIELTSAETDLLVAGSAGGSVTEYTWQLVLKWTSEELTFSGTVLVRHQIGDPA